MDQHQAGDDAVGGQPIAQVVGALVLRQQAEDPLQPGAVELDHRGDQLLGPRAAGRVGEPLELAAEALDALDQLLDRGFAGAQHIPVGVCITLRTRPPPLYMCTPHGRHGSKLRTARMMSMPLKCSRSFSSKIGVF